MTTLANFLHDVMFEGRIRFDAAPTDAADAAAPVMLRRAYDAYALTIAGPTLPLHEATALAAAQLLLRSAWYFLNPGLLIEAPEKILFMPNLPTGLEHHLSADLTLRFLPALYHRAKALMPNDVLPTALDRILRQWPLSGVLAEIVEPPLTPADFGAHAGLHFLYAERLAEHERPGWFPRGHGMQYVELVWQQLGKDVSVLPALAELAQEMVAQENHV